MKKLCAIILLLLASSALSEVSLGVNLSTNLYTSNYNYETGNRETKTTYYNLFLAPTLIFLLNDRFELAPHAGVSVTYSKMVTYIDGDKDTTTDNTDFGAGGGCGFFLRLVDKSVFRLSLGPEASFWFYNFDNLRFETTLGLPLNLDLLITDRFFARMKLGLFAFRYYHTQDMNGFTFFDIRTTAIPGIGFYFTF